jgi:transcriptional regulator with XRE-family HTH domain
MHQGTGEGSDESLRRVGQRIKELRSRRNWKLADLSASSGVSVGSLSEIERGLANPSFMTLVKIAHSLGVPVVALLDAERSASPVVRRANRRRLSLPFSPEGVISELLSPDVASALELVWTEWPPGLSSEHQPFSHAGEECGLLLEGTLEVGVNGQVYRLEPGDSIAYASTVPHWYRNPGATPAKSVWAITPPSC